MTIKWLICFLFCVQMISSIIYSIPEIHLTSAEAHRANMLTSELGYLITSSVRIQFDKIYQEPVAKAKFLRFIDRKGGIQLYLFHLNHERDFKKYKYLRFQPRERKLWVCERAEADFIHVFYFCRRNGKSTSGPSQCCHCGCLQWSTSFSWGCHEKFCGRMALGWFLFPTICSMEIIRWLSHEHEGPIIA